MQRICLWRLAFASLAVSLTIGLSVASWNATVDHEGFERSIVLREITKDAGLNRGFRKAEIVDGEAAGGGNRLGGEHERPEGRGGLHDVFRSWRKTQEDEETRDASVTDLELHNRGSIAQVVV